MRDTLDTESWDKYISKMERDVYRTQNTTYKPLEQVIKGDSKNT